MLKTWENELHRISDWLGNDHDLVVLQEIITREKISFQDRSAEQLFRALTTHQREEWQDNALLRGQQLYHDPPIDFKKRMANWWSLSEG